MHEVDFVKLKAVVKEVREFLIITPADHPAWFLALDHYVKKELEYRIELERRRTDDNKETSDH